MVALYQNDTKIVVFEQKEPLPLYFFLYKQGRLHPRAIDETLLLFLRRSIKMRRIFFFFNKKKIIYTSDSSHNFLTIVMFPFKI